MLDINVEDDVKKIGWVRISMDGKVKLFWR